MTLESWVLGPYKITDLTHIGSILKLTRSLKKIRFTAPVSFEPIAKNIPKSSKIGNIENWDEVVGMMVFAKSRVLKYITL